MHLQSLLLLYDDQRALDVAGADRTAARGLGAGSKGGSPNVQVSYMVVAGNGTFIGTNANTNLDFKGAVGVFLMSAAGRNHSTIDCNRTADDGKPTERAFVVHSGEAFTGTRQVRD